MSLGGPLPRKRWDLDIKADPDAPGYGKLEKRVSGPFWKEVDDRGTMRFRVRLACQRCHTHIHPIVEEFHANEDEAVMGETILNDIQENALSVYRCRTCEPGMEPVMVIYKDPKAKLPGRETI